MIEYVRLHVVKEELKVSYLASKAGRDGERTEALLSSPLLTGVTKSMQDSTTAAAGAEARLVHAIGP